MQLPGHKPAHKGRAAFKAVSVFKPVYNLVANGRLRLETVVVIPVRHFESAGIRGLGELAVAVVRILESVCVDSLHAPSVFVNNGYNSKIHHMAPMPKSPVMTEPIQKAIVIRFHFLCHCSSSFSNSLKYFR